MATIDATSGTESVVSFNIGACKICHRVWKLARYDSMHALSHDRGIVLAVAVSSLHCGAKVFRNIASAEVRQKLCWLPSSLSSICSLSAAVLSVGVAAASVSGDELCSLAGAPRSYVQVTLLLAHKSQTSPPLHFVLFA